jgi:hypothetical protein
MRLAPAIDGSNRHQMTDSLYQRLNAGRGFLFITDSSLASAACLKLILAQHH